MKKEIDAKEMIKRLGLEKKPKLKLCGVIRSVIKSKYLLAIFLGVLTMIGLTLFSRYIINIPEISIGWISGGVFMIVWSDL